MEIKRSEIKCRMQIHGFCAHLLTYVTINDKNLHFLCTLLPFLTVFRAFFNDYLFLESKGEHETYTLILYTSFLVAFEPQILVCVMKGNDFITS